MENYSFDLGENTQAPKKRSWLKLSSFIVGTVAVAALLVYSGGFEAVLKLFGVGASGIYEITITNNRQWLGGDYAEDDWVVGESQMDGVGVFGSFSASPADPHLDEGQKGLIVPIFSSPADPTRESYLNHSYISPIVDLTLSSARLSAVEVTDFMPMGSDIDYAYRWGDSPEAVTAKSFMPLDPSVVNSLQGDVRVASAIVEGNVQRYLQIKVDFSQVDNPLTARPAVYAVSFQYKDAGEISESDLTEFRNLSIPRMISIQYATPNAPRSADIDVISSELDNRIIHSVKGVDLSERLGYSFNLDLKDGAYAVAVSAPGVNTIVTPFLVGGSTDITVDLGSFEPSIGQNVGADLNGDGVVNSLDLQILLNQFS